MIIPFPHPPTDAAATGVPNNSILELLGNTPRAIALLSGDVVNETDVLLAVVANPSGFSIKAGTIMSGKFVKIPITNEVTDLPQVFEQGRVVAVVHRDQFLVLITPIDFLNYPKLRIA